MKFKYVNTVNGKRVYHCTVPIPDRDALGQYTLNLTQFIDAVSEDLDTSDFHLDKTFNPPVGPDSETVVQVLISDAKAARTFEDLYC